MSSFNLKLGRSRNAWLWAVCCLIAIGMTQGLSNRSGLARAAVAICCYETDHGRFPTRGSLYESTNGTIFQSPELPIPIELVSLSLQSVSPISVALPQPGTSMFGDSFFDVFVDFRTPGGNFHIDSFFDITYRLDGQSAGPMTAEVETEMLQLELHGEFPGGPTGPIPLLLRESPTLPSRGHHAIREIPGGTFQIDSFFDVFTELSLDGGQNWIPAQAPVRVELTRIGVPEPASLALVGVAITIGLAARVRRRKN